jgi:hypothetical protein
MAYWITSLILIAFGFLAMFSIGRPFLLIGLALLILGPIRGRPALFWPPLASVVAWNIAFLAVAPWTCTMTSIARTGDPVGGLGNATTVCTSLLGSTTIGPGSFNPSLAPANQAALLAAAVTFVVVLVVIVGLPRARRS